MIFKTIFIKFLKNKLFKRSFLFVFFSGLNGLIPFLLLPIITNYLNPQEFGVASLFQTTLLFIIPLVGLSMGFNIDKLFFKVNKNKLAISIGNMLVILFFMILIFTFLIFICSLFTSLSFTGIPVFWLLIIPTVSGFAAINEYNLILLRNQNKVMDFGFWQIGLTILNMSLSLFLIIFMMRGWEGRAEGIVLSIFTVSFLSLYNIRKMGFLSFDINSDEIKAILKLCIPLLLHGLGTFAIFQSNRYFINIHLNEAAVGVFSVAVSFSALMGIIKDGLSRTLNPWFYENFNNNSDLKNFKIQIVRINIAVFLILIFLTFLITLFANFVILNFIDSEYHSAISYVFILTLSMAIYAIYGISFSYFIHFSKTKLLSSITLCSALIGLFLNYFLTMYYGISGASYALFITMIFQLLLLYYYKSKFFPVPFITILINDFYKFVLNRKDIK
jgi:O-antigen/teichoic acid export membrane protein